MRPRIGITTSTLERAPEGAIQVSAATHLAYAECVYHAGGLPLLLPNLPEGEDAEEVLSHLDGLLLSGGGDIDPAYWHEDPHPALGLVDHVRDTFEIALVKAAVRNDTPTLGICRGVQIMAIATGGDLWQDIPSQRPNSLNHRQTTLREQPSHDIEIAPGSPLAQVFWPDSAGNCTLAVNSFHHQAPRNCGTLLSVVATSPDGLIEAVSLPHARFFLGVQWHPEMMVNTDPCQARLFSTLVAAASGQLVFDHS